MAKYKAKKTKRTVRHREVQRYKDKAELIELIELRQAILRRDNYTCCRCGLVHRYPYKRARVHHILNWSSCIEGRKDPYNLVVFCLRDHSLFHKRYGMTNNTREQLEEFILSYKPWIKSS